VQAHTPGALPCIHQVRCPEHALTQPMYPAAAWAAPDATNYTAPWCFSHAALRLPPAACSPHIRSFNERIAVDGAPIPASQLDSLAERHAGTVEAAQAREAGALSHFEIVTALAYKHFQEQQVGSKQAATGTTVHAAHAPDSGWQCGWQAGLHHALRWPARGRSGMMQMSPDAAALSWPLTSFHAC
jgi:hypothetical protein